jgi:type IV pilus assembly protein PilO
MKGLNKLPWYAQILLFVVLSGGVIYLFHYLYADGQQLAIGEKERELTAVRARITRGMLIAQQLPTFQAEVLKLEAHFEGLKQVLPEQRDVGEMLRRMQTLAAQSSLNVRVFRPQPVANKTLHAEWPMFLEFDGNYHDLGLFFDRVSKVPRIINIGNIVLKSKDAKVAVAQSASITAAVTATTFVLLEKPLVDPKAKGKGSPKDAKLSAQNTAAVR